MGLADDIRADVQDIFRTQWTSRDGNVVPETDSLALANDAVKLDATVLYADLADSTAMVNSKTPTFSAEVYKTFLITACRVIRANEGVITAFDGDRVMAVFIGGQKNTVAATTALQIKWAVDDIVNPALTAQYQGTDFSIRFGVGIDTSSLWVARAGIRGSNDLIWVGRAANYAAKLCSLSEGAYTSWITGDVFNMLNDSAKFGGKDKQLMWDKRIWTAYGIEVYRSNWSWGF